MHASLKASVVLAIVLGCTARMYSTTVFRGTMTATITSAEERPVGLPPNQLPELLQQVYTGYYTYNSSTINGTFYTALGSGLHPDDNTSLNGGVTFQYPLQGIYFGGDSTGSVTISGGHFSWAAQNPSQEGPWLVSFSSSDFSAWGYGVDPQINVTGTVRFGNPVRVPDASGATAVLLGLGLGAMCWVWRRKAGRPPVIAQTVFSLLLLGLLAGRAYAGPNTYAGTFSYTYTDFLTRPDEYSPWVHTTSVPGLTLGSTFTGVYGYQSDTIDGVFGAFASDYLGYISFYAYSGGVPGPFPALNFPNYYGGGITVLGGQVVDATAAHQESQFIVSATLNTFQIVDNQSYQLYAGSGTVRWSKPHRVPEVGSIYFYLGPLLVLLIRRVRRCPPGSAPATDDSNGETTAKPMGGS